MLKQEERRGYLFQAVQNRDEESDIREPLVVEISNSFHELRRWRNCRERNRVALSSRRAQMPWVKWPGVPT